MALQLIVELGLEPSLAVRGVVVLLTYLLHGAIWSACVALLVRSRAFAASTQSYLWLAALLGPLLTSVVASSAHGASVALVTLAPASDTHAVSAGSRMPLCLLLGLAVAALLGTLQFAAKLLSLRRRLHDRAQVDDPRVLRVLNELQGRTSLRHVVLSHSRKIDVPLVFGRSEICLPYSRPLTDRSHAAVSGAESAPDAELAAVLAHELAHLERRDGVLFPLMRLLQSLLWLHPLNHWLAAHVRRCAELACDDRAVELTGNRSALAHALARVATHGYPLLPAMASARPQSVLVLRVRRLLDDGGGARPRARAAWAALSCSVLVVATVSLRVQAATPALATEQIGELMAQEQQLGRELASAAGDDVRVLELEQALRHTRERAAWIERSVSGQASP